MDLHWRWRVSLGAAGVLVAGAAIGAVLVGAADEGGSVPMASIAVEASGQDTVMVDVQGAVASPGVYQLPSGARVVDAIAKAGGATADADTSSLNLAQEVVDGSQILVAVMGAAATEGADSGLVNINSADATELETLPRVGPALAAAIIAYRDEHGPFTAVSELDGVSGIGPAVLAQLQPMCTV